MIWVFERDGERLRCEISRDDMGGVYRLAVTWPNGTNTFEDIGQPTVLLERSVQLMDGLRRDGWHVQKS
jgi:hypothetical protein